MADDELAWLRVSELHTSAQRVSRSRLQANQSESAGYKVTLQLSGRSEIRQASRRALLAPGEWGVYDTTRPYEVDVDDNAHFLVMQVPGRQVQAWEPYMQNAVARVFSARQGCGRMAMDLLRVALGEHAHLSESAARDAANAVMQMMGLDISERAGGRADQEQAGCARRNCAACSSTSWRTCTIPSCRRPWPRPRCGCRDAICTTCSPRPRPPRRISSSARA